MIEVRALLDERAGRTVIEVTGHGRVHPGDVDGASACTAVSVCTQTALAFLDALAQQYPDHIHFTIEETPPCPA